MKSDQPAKTVVITGASSGIARATAFKFASAGYNTVIAARSPADLASVASQCKTLGSASVAIPVDTASQEQVDELASKAYKAFGSIDVWVNAAAVTAFGKLDEIPYDVCRKLIETNILGYIHGSRAALQYFKRQGHGTLINVSSQVSKVGAPHSSLYVASKFAINGLSESLRMELKDTPDVHVCTVLPASIDTPLFQHAANFSGRAVKPLDPVYPADRVANTIFELSQKPKREVIVGPASLGFIALRYMWPWLGEKVIARRVEHNHFQDRPANPTKGNIFEPMPDYNEVSGGWMSPPRRSVAKTAAVAAIGTAAVAGAGLLAYKFLKPKPKAFSWKKILLAR